MNIEKKLNSENSKIKIFFINFTFKIKISSNLKRIGKTYLLKSYFKLYLMNTLAINQIYQLFRSRTQIQNSKRLHSKHSKKNLILYLKVLHLREKLN